MTEWMDWGLIAEQWPLYLQGLQVTLILLVMQKQILVAFWANPALNGLIFLVLFLGIVFAFAQVAQQFQSLQRLDLAVDVDAAQQLAEGWKAQAGFWFNLGGLLGALRPLFRWRLALATSASRARSSRPSWPRFTGITLPPATPTRPITSPLEHTSTH